MWLDNLEVWMNLESTVRSIHDFGNGVGGEYGKGGVGSVIHQAWGVGGRWKLSF